LYAQFLEKKHAKIQKNSRSVGEDTTLAAAPQKFLKFSRLDGGGYLFLGKIDGGGGSPDRLKSLHTLNKSKKTINC
jgi:hypothetical protein